MGKIISALNKASEERLDFISSQEEINKDLNMIKKESKMRKVWFTWLFVAAVVVMVFITFNYQSGKDAVPLSEIFPDEEVTPVDVEYEFVQEDTAKEDTIKGEKQEVVAVPAVEPPALAAVVKAKEEVVPAKKIAPQVTESKYTVQIASFKDSKKAEEALTKIRKNVPSAYMSAQDLGGKGVWYRIYAGQFNARSEAEISLSDIKRNYNDSFIISPKKGK